MITHTLITDNGLLILRDVSLETLKLYFALGFREPELKCEGTEEYMIDDKWREFRHGILQHLNVEAKLENGSDLLFHGAEIFTLLFNEKDAYNRGNAK